MVRHLAVIMDGNGRYGEKIGKTRSEGYKFGAQALIKALNDFASLPIDVMSVFAFSKENNKRSIEEVSNIYNVIAYFLKKEVFPCAYEKGIGVKIIGDISSLPDHVREVVSSAPLFKNGKTLVIAINYGGDDEIVRSMKKISEKGGEITTENLKRNLDTFPLPDPDIVLRYGGYQRLSNFLPIQTAYSELFFTDKLWPEYDISDFTDVMKKFEKIKRNFGA